MADGPVLVIGTRKGAWLLSGDAERDSWRGTEPMFLGHIVQHAMIDPRDQRTLLLATRTGHLGPDHLPFAGPGPDAGPRPAGPRRSRRATRSSAACGRCSG